MHTRLQRLTWLAFVLVSLLLPVTAVAHDHAHDSGVTALEQCLVCQVAGQATGPLPVARDPLSFPRAGLSIPLPRSEAVFSPHHASRCTPVRGPPRV